MTKKAVFQSSHRADVLDKKLQNHTDSLAYCECIAPPGRYPGGQGHNLLILKQ
ncbi:MAG: hypothetical protein ACTSRA_13515 [Promethearchaeota archaeon]